MHTPAIRDAPHDAGKNDLRRIFGKARDRLTGHRCATELNFAGSIGDRNDAGISGVRFDDSNLGIEVLVITCDFLRFCNFGDDSLKVLIDGLEILSSINVMRSMC